MPTVRELVAGLKVDAWRSRVGFTADVQDAHDRLDSALTKDAKAQLINSWLGAGRNQPCLFGRMAARFGRIGFCVIDDEDLKKPDDEIRQLIQDQRLAWIRRTFRGEQSAFVLLVLSKTIALAEPDDTMKDLAGRVILLYLQREPRFDEVILEEAFLEKPGWDTVVWRWDVGVNYFCAQGDKRWWHDHRIPGGFAFSVNSVGHLAKSTQLTGLLDGLNAELGIDGGATTAQHVDSLEKALEFAMRTIDGASTAVSGKATCLRDRGPATPACPIALPRHLQAKDPTTYFGLYHTDHTLPSAYFTPAVERSGAVPGHDLDFTYLWLRSPENPAYYTMGQGVRVREDLTVPELVRADKRGHVIPEEIRAADANLLRRAFEQKH